ncbi:MBL fold metallo-hydrolase [Georgenia ruanii]
MYAIADGDGVCLVDGGWAVDGAIDQLAESLATIGQSLRSVTRVLVTHMHLDHYTLAVALRRSHGTPIVLGEGERASVDALIADERPQHERDLRAWGVVQPPARAGFPPHEGRYEPPDVWLDGPTDVTLADRVLHAIPTPGHTTGHLVFADVAGGMLFSGDHVLPHITPSIGLQNVRSPYPLEEYLASLRLMLDLPDLAVLPAHGPVGHSLHERSRQLLAHHEQRLVECAASVGAGASTAFETAEAMRWTRRGHHLSELDGLAQTLAVGETAAHLEVLARRGELDRAEVDGVVRYTVASVVAATPVL